MGAGRHTSSSYPKSKVDHVKRNPGLASGANPKEKDMSIGRRRGCRMEQQDRRVPGLFVGTGPGMAAVLLALLWAATPILALAQGVPTSITVRVVAHDAKIIG